MARTVNESLPEDDRSKTKLFLPDVIRRVAKENKDIGLMEEAVRLYESCREFGRASCRERV